jgi:trehalose 6-phosphate synthase
MAVFLREIYIEAPMLKLFKNEGGYARMAWL